MITSISTIIILMLTCILMNILLIYLLKQKKPTQAHKLFIIMCLLTLFWILELVLQATYSNTFNINPIYFDYFVYINTCFLPVVLFLFSLSLLNTKIYFKKVYLLLFIIPIISLIVLWTNDYHHLFYKVYSVNLTETQTGPYANVHIIYSFLLYAIGMIILYKCSVKTSGFFSKQAMLILIGSICPILVNFFATIGIISTSIYMTPISLTITVLLYALALFKFDFLKVAPIALQKIVDRMSDSYIVLNENMVITDYNQTLLDTFNLNSSKIRNVNIIDLIASIPDFDIDVEILISAINKTKLDDSTIVLEKHFSATDNYFHIEINRITNKGNFLGTLILLKDVTQHNKDIQTIKENQEMLIEKERLASLGQMIGGIAHNLKTPIMSISGAAEGISDLINEYRSSVGDSEVTIDDHHEIAKEMDTWIEKIRTHLSYMSDIITAVKGQAVNFSDTRFNGFTVEELVKHVDILMKHELKNALINLNTSVNIDEKTNINGNINSLVQVINNIISNAIQAYNGKTNENINFILNKEKNNLVIKVQDFAGGLPKNVQDKLFKEMITTKGKNGTGLGLFMSYSNIKAHFSGNLKYETKKGDGTTFIITIPLSV